MSELLFEIGAEELPAGYIQPALAALAENATKKLHALDLSFASMSTFGGPRRLALSITGLQARQTDRRQEHVGPSKQAGFDAEGKPTKAAIGFARSKGCEPDQLQVVETAKGAYLMVVEDVKGRETKDLLPGLLESLVRELVFPKSMHWADSPLLFARPIQWLLAVYDGEVTPFCLEGIHSGMTTRGHRFLAPAAFEVHDLRGYLDGLRERWVVADHALRRSGVVENVRLAVADAADGAAIEPILHEGLIDTVTNLVEYPFGVCGRFDDKFLQLPEEVLVTSMREHQKYFPVADAQGRLVPLFVAVNNTRVKDVALTRSGHERVLRARLEDALFFYNEDRKQTLASRCAHLDGIVFQQKLGTMRAKTERLVALAGLLARMAAPELQARAEQAAQLAKADLLTAMVGEFPILQGVMGRVYALFDGAPPEVAQAIEEHYLPLRAGGELPRSLIGALVGLADRLDTLVGCFAIGEKPTGNKDVFGLRRQAIGLIALIRGHGLSLSLRTLVEAALQGYAGVAPQDAAIVTSVVDFIRLRFANEQMASGFSQGAVEAATSVAFDDLLDALRRIEALEQIRGQNSFVILAGSFKRIRNIVKDNTRTAITESLLVEPAEQALHQALSRVREAALPLLEVKDYPAALLEMLTMKEAVDRFFDEVMVMADDAAMRQNRLNLLTALGELVLRVGDISRMHAEKD